MVLLPTFLLMLMMRLDAFLSDGGLCTSRTEAKNFILEGAVSVNGSVIKKPAFEVDGTENIVVDRASKRFVSRGGYKLEAALDHFDISVEGLSIIDVGASSGGFTDCLLKRGAEHVIAVDSGTMQLSQVLRDDPRVTVMENYNARYMEPSHFERSVDFAVMDVSFISATLIIPAVYGVLSSGGRFVCLIKPQFEVGRSGIGKGGIVKNDSLRRGAIDKVVESARSVGFELCGVMESPILGGDGNIEFLAYFKRRA